MRSLPSLLDSIGVKSHTYAVDTQFWISFYRIQEHWTREQITEAFSGITGFMLNISLKLNANKTMFIPFTRVRQDFEPLHLDKI
jgi:hypothetical protein